MLGKYKVSGYDKHYSNCRTLVELEYIMGGGGGGVLLWKPWGEFEKMLKNRRFEDVGEIGGIEEMLKKIRVFDNSRKNGVGKLVIWKEVKKVSEFCFGGSCLNVLLLIIVVMLLVLQ